MTLVLEYKIHVIHGEVDTMRIKHIMPCGFLARISAFALTHEEPRSLVEIRQKS